jgi:hypothetical protein
VSSSYTDVNIVDDKTYISYYDSIDYLDIFISDSCTYEFGYFDVEYTTGYVVMTGDPTPDGFNGPDLVTSYAFAGRVSKPIKITSKIYQYYFKTDNVCTVWINLYMTKGMDYGSVSQMSHDSLTVSTIKDNVSDFITASLTPAGSLTSQVYYAESEFDATDVDILKVVVRVPSYAQSRIYKMYLRNGTARSEVDLFYIQNDGTITNYDYLTSSTIMVQGNGEVVWYVTVTLNGSVTSGYVGVYFTAASDSVTPESNLTELRTSCVLKYISGASLSLIPFVASAPDNVAVIYTTYKFTNTLFIIVPTVFTSLSGPSINIYVDTSCEVVARGTFTVSGIESTTFYEAALFEDAIYVTGSYFTPINASAGGTEYESLHFEYICYPTTNGTKLYDIRHFSESVSIGRLLPSDYGTNVEFIVRPRDRLLYH